MKEKTFLLKDYFVSYGTNKTPKLTFLDEDDVEALAAKFINPTKVYKRVFIFHIDNSLEQNRTVYNATRNRWRVAEENQTRTTTYAVGVKNSVLRGAYAVNNWK